MEKEMEKCDIAIIGCGPAGLSAAINSTIRRKSVILFGGEFCTPKLQQSPIVNNYLGLPEIPGRVLREKFLEHVSSLSIPIHQEKVDLIDINEDEGFSIITKDKNFQARSVILATGVTVHKLIEGEQEFAGKGVGYCATCDGPLYRDKDVALIAYTPEGVEEANFLAGFCRKVYFIPGSEQSWEGLKPGVEVIENKKIESIIGDGFVTGVKLDGLELPVDGVFIYRETFLPESLVPGLAVKDNHVQVDRGFQTSIKGVYAAGDCTGKPYQLAKAVGEGQVAALNTSQYLDLLN